MLDIGYCQCILHEWLCKLGAILSIFSGKIVDDWGQYIHNSDMIFVQNITQPDFQAKSFTQQKYVICDIFLAN